MVDRWLGSWTKYTVVKCLRIVPEKRGISPPVLFAQRAELRERRGFERPRQKVPGQRAGKSGGGGLPGQRPKKEKWTGRESNPRHQDFQSWGAGGIGRKPNPG